jgi:hypothetical protein
MMRGAGGGHGSRQSGWPMVIMVLLKNAINPNYLSDSW